MRHVKQENPSKEAIYTIRVDRDTLDAMQKIAANERRSLASKIRVMFDEEIARNQPTEAAA